MSRALDIETTLSLYGDNVQNVYNDIAAVLCPQPPILLELEFLGKSHPLPPGINLLVDGNNVAIPKAKLVQAFLHARSLFFDRLRPCPENDEEELFRATAVILLMDPEHLTAANSRKRQLQTYQKGTKQLFEAALKRELLFVDSYLTSRLHRHTKSPTLWSHRKWLLEAFEEAALDWDCGNDINVILVAAERHPRNYYAWLHFRWLIQRHDGGRKGLESERVLEIVKKWCLNHPADTSGFSFLGFYLEHLGLQQASGSVAEDVLLLTRSYKWVNESVWVFLRTLAASEIKGEQSLAFIETHYLMAAASQGDPKATKVLRLAMEWYQKNRRHPETETDNFGRQVGS